MDEDKYGPGTPTANDTVPFARRGGTNPANEVPKKMRSDDKGYIDDKLRMFKRGHAMNVHRDQMDLIRKNARDNARKRKI